MPLAKITENEFEYFINGVDVEYFNRRKKNSIDIAKIKSFPLYEIYLAIKKANTPKLKTTLKKYAVDFYGRSCVDEMFFRFDEMGFEE